MPCFLHAADIHLDSPLRSLEQYEGAPVEAIRGAVRRAFDGLVDRACAEPVDFLLISGDLYDGDWQDYNTGLFFISRMARLREAEIPVFLVAGNHDAASRMTRSLRLPDNVHLFSADQPETRILERSGVAIHGQSFAAPAVKRNLARHFPDPVPGCCNIGMLHTALSGREGHAPYAPCTPEELKGKGYDYWALGHVHQREMVQQDPWIVFPGNIQGRHARETGPKGCMQVALAPDGTLAPAFHPLACLRWETLEISPSGCRTPDAVVSRAVKHAAEQCRSHPETPLAVRLHLSGPCPAHESLTADPERWRNEIRAALVERLGERVWLEKVICDTRPPESDPTVPEGPFSEVMALLEEIAAPDLDPELAAWLDDLTAPLQKKLPPPLTSDSPLIETDAAAWRKSLAKEAGALLHTRLTGTESDGAAGGPEAP